RSWAREILGTCVRGLPVCAERKRAFVLAATMTWGRGFGKSYCRTFPVLRAVERHRCRPPVSSLGRSQASQSCAGVFTCPTPFAAPERSFQLEGLSVPRAAGARQREVRAGPRRDRARDRSPGRILDLFCREN